MTNADWNATEGSAQILNKPTNVSAFNNDRGYLTSYTEQQILTISNDTIYLTGGSFVKLPAGFDGDYNSLTNKPNLANVATSGDYNDLSNTPTIPTVPTNVSEFTNDAGYITSSAVPTNVSQLNNDANYITSNDIPEQVNADWNATEGTAQILNKPTNVSAFNNDRGYLTSYTEQQILTMSNDTIYLTGGSFVKLPAGFDGDYNSLTNKPNLANVATSGDYNDLSNTPTIPTVPTNVSEFNNDAGYITSAAVPTNVSQLNNDANYITSNDIPEQVNADWNATEGAAQILNKPTNVSAFNNDRGYLTSYTEQQILTISNDTIYLTGGSFVKLPAGFDGDYNSLTNKPNLANVATSGDYNDLSNTPTIPTVPTNVSEFTNDAGYITSAAVPTNVSQLNNDANYITTEAIPTNVSAFTNDAGYITTAAVPTNVSQLNNDANYITSAAIPTNVSAFNNDRGYLTSYTEQQILTISNDTIYLTGGSFVKLPAGFDGDYNSLTNKPNLFSGNYNDLTNKPDLFSGDYNDLNNKPNLANVATSGSYNDLSNTPTIPRVPTNVSEFTNDANYITSAAIPTQVSAFTNDAGYITSAAVPTNVSQFNNDANYITANDVPAQVNSDWNATSGSAQILNKPNLSTVATSGNYNDLNNTPTIPRVPTNVSEFTNDANYITSAAIPTRVSAFTNDAGYITSSAVPTNVSQLNNDARYVTNDSCSGLSFCDLAAQITQLQRQAARQQQIIDSLTHTLAIDPPTVSTNAISYITLNSAIGGGNVTASGGGNITARGVCWSTNQYPTISDSHTTDGTGTGAFSSNLTGLTANITYYVRAYATNIAGTAYGAQQSFTTTPVDGQPCPTAATVIDVDGNVYNTVKIGQQCWLKENLRTTKYADGTDISLGSSASSTTAYRYYPNNSSGNVATYGYLYSWPAVMHNSSSSDSNPSGVQGICPNGWHVPSDAEWTQLTNYVSSQSQYVCESTSTNIAKALASTAGWSSSTITCAVGNNPSTNNATGFSTLPAGFYNGSYGSFGGYAYFWSATQYDASTAYYRYLYSNNAGVGSYNSHKGHGFSVRCLRNEGGSPTPSLPTVSTTAVRGIIQTAATSGGNVEADGGQTVTARGVCWSTSENPTIADSYTTDGTGTGAFSSNLTGLTANTTYYVRAYATNSVGVAYGSAETFTTSTASLDGQPCPNAATLTDVDGNVYNTVQIGQQCWLKENLRTTKYADGTDISLGSSASSTTAYRYYPNNSSGNVATYGYLYNWPAVMHNSSSSDSNPSGVQGICPNGWHVPSDAEWTQLTNYVSSQSQYVCESTSTNIAKALASTAGWNSSTITCAVGNNPSTNNATGFSALPAGYYGGSYGDFGSGAYFWSATQHDASGAYYRDLGYYNARVLSDGNSKSGGFSVRCLRD